jgi:hypothetical protein
LKNQGRFKIGQTVLSAQVADTEALAMKTLAMKTLCQEKPVTFGEVWHTDTDYCFGNGTAL